MEDSFGTQKEHYGLRKVAARIKSTEIMLICFGVHTSNVINLARQELFKPLLQSDIPRVERDFTGVLAPGVTEDEKTGSETRAEDINSDEYDRKNTGSLPVDSDLRN